MLLAGILPAIVNTLPAMVLQKVHENRMTQQQAWRESLNLGWREYFAYCRTAYVGVMMFLATRQFIFEHSIRIFRRRLRLTERQSDLLASLVSVLAANTVFQPMEVIIAHMAVGHRDIVRTLRASQDGLWRSLWKGAYTRLVLSFSFNFAWMPIYTHLKSKYDLFAYV